MEKLLFLLVCEGPTDILTIKNIAREISQKIDKDIEIRELSPQRDETTHRYPHHGWKEVRKWCKLYGKSLNNNSNSLESFAAKNKNWKALVSVSKANALIIQIDTDIVEYIDEIEPKYNGSTKNARKRFLDKAILQWLGEDTIPEKVFLLKSTYSTETWLLATFDRDNEVFNNLDDQFDFEEIEDINSRLFTLGFDNYTDENGKQKLSKDLSKYTNYAQKIASNIDKVREECDEAEFLCNEFEKDFS